MTDPSTMRTSGDAGPERAARAPRTRGSRALSIIGVVLSGAMLAALYATWERSKDLPVLPSIRAIALAALLVSLGLGAATAAWVALFERHHDRLLLIDGMMLSQLGKYAPGGLWQPAGQVVLARRAGVPGPKAVAALPAYLLGAATAATIAASVVGWREPSLLDGWGRGLLLGVLAVLMWQRRVLESVLRTARRFWSRVPSVGDLPSQRRLVRSGLWHLIGLTLQGGAFAALVSSVIPEVDLVLAVGAFSLAWVIGFLAVPVPAGIGLRETVLVAVLGGTTVAGPVVAAAVVHRLINIAAEALAIGVVRFGVHRRAARGRRLAYDLRRESP